MDVTKAVAKTSFRINWISMNPSDEQLMTAYAEGDMQAFDQLYARHKGRILGYLYHKLHNRDDAEEVFQATFAKLHAARDRYHADTPFLPWIFTIARNALTDHFRRNQTYRKNLLSYGEALLNAAAAESPNRSVGSTLFELSTLTPHQREALKLRYDQDFSFAEIAARLQTSKVNARQMVSRAIRQLRRVLGASKGL